MSVQERHRRERHARGQAILTAAAKVFARHGLEGATIEMVAREAEVAVGTIYLYYSSRDDLYLNLIADRAGQLRARYLEIFALRLEPLAELKAIASAYLDYLRESRELFLSQHSVVFSQLHQRLRRKSEIRNFQRVMDLSPEHWRGYVPQDDAEGLTRLFGLSDRIRYYWPRPEVQTALRRLFANVDDARVPPGLVSQFAGEMLLERSEPTLSQRLIAAKVEAVVTRYRRASGLNGTD